MFVAKILKFSLEKNEKSNYSLVLEEKEKKFNELDLCLYTIIKNDVIVTQ